MSDERFNFGNWWHAYSVLVAEAECDTRLSCSDCPACQMLKRAPKNWGCWALWDEALRYTGNSDLVKVTDTKKHIADEVKRRYDNGQEKGNAI